MMDEYENDDVGNVHANCSKYEAGHVRESTSIPMQERIREFLKREEMDESEWGTISSKLIVRLIHYLFRAALSFRYDNVFVDIQENLQGQKQASVITVTESCVFR